MVDIEVKRTLKIYNGSSDSFNEVIDTIKMLIDEIDEDEEIMNLRTGEIIQAKELMRVSGILCGLNRSDNWVINDSF